MGLQDGPNNGCSAPLASNHLPGPTALCSLDSPESLYSLASLGYYYFSRYIHTFFYAFAMLVPINVLLAFTNPKSPHFPQALFRLSLSALSLSCSPLDFGWKLILQHTTICQTTYMGCIPVSPNELWTRGGQQSPPIHLCPFGSILHNSCIEQVSIKVCWHGIKFTNCVKSLILMAFSWIAEPHRHSDKPLQGSFLRGYVLLLGS